MSLQSSRKGPENVDAAVIFLHGYGADGADLLGLADPLGPHLPKTSFYAPNAPEPCVNNPMGYQWFPIPWLDGSSEAQAQASMTRSVELLNDFVDHVLSRDKLSADRLVVVGFSQGTMMALHVLPRRADAVAGIVGFSGRLLLPNDLAHEAKVKPPILLAHGDQDPMVPYQDMGLAEKALRDAGFTVSTHTMPGTGHGIAPDGLSVALQFIKQCLTK